MSNDHAEFLGLRSSSCARLTLPTAQEIASGDDFIVLGSDGLYDVLSNQEICGMCYELQSSPAQVIADHLVATALHRGSMVRIFFLHACCARPL